MIASINKRFLTSFGMTGSWAESKGRSGDSPEFFSFICKSEANRHFFLFTLINDLSFRALARNRVPLRRDELTEGNLILIINHSRYS
jgi:hypothetical protein